jgi:hypothetical protein
MKSKDFKECRNPGCNRHKMATYTEEKFCDGKMRNTGARCGSKLKSADLTEDEKKAWLESEDNSRKTMPAKFEDKKLTVFSDDTWEVEDGGCVDGNCPVEKDAEKPKLIIPREMWESWITLTKRFDTEWIAYLVGNKIKEREWEVVDMYFPKQKATSVHVEAEQGEMREGTVAAVHSHVGMGVFFSKEDEDHANHDVEVVINRDAKYKMSVRVKLECGRFARVEGELLLRGNEKADDPLIKQLKEVLKEEKFVTTTYSGHSHNRHRGGHGGDGDTSGNGHYRHGHWVGDDYYES